ncbi:MAG: SWIM zinc finger family protein [Clostridiales bacterium]|nr:SWIM zinc finger family protein [Clostridiales bacterium]
MGLLECASGASVWRGYDYFKRGNVKSVEKMEENVFSAAVSGSAVKPYAVELRIDHPRKSKCSCPHANGKRIVCKHMVAVYFTVFPQQAEAFYVEAMAYQEEQEAQAEELSDRVCQYVQKMKKAELQQALLELLFDGPEWQFDRFLREYRLDEDEGRC